MTQSRKPYLLPERRKSLALRSSTTAMALVAVACFVGLSGTEAFAKGGTAKPPPPGPVGSCPTGALVGNACIVPPAGPVLPNFPVAAGAITGNGSNGFSMIGYVQSVTGPGCPAAATNLTGGTVKINDVVVTIPDNTIVQYPANTLTWGQAICGSAPIAVDGTGGTGPVIYPGVELRVDGNIVAPAGGTAGIGSPHVGALVFVSQQFVNIGSGYISAINYATGMISVSTQGGGTANLLINDPKGRYGIAKVPPVDARFSVDDANPTIKAAASGYPMCVPRGSATGDPQCPQKNRPTAGCRNFAASGTGFRIAGADIPTAVNASGFCSAFVMKALAGFPGTQALRPALDIAVPGTDPDPREMAPFEVGDFINWQGTLVHTAGASTATDVIWVHTIDANVGIYTQPGTLPSYIAIGNVSIGVDPLPANAVAIAGVEATPRLVVEANTSDVSSIVDFYLDDRGFGLPAGANLAGDVAIVPDAVGTPAREYFRWLTPESMTGTVTDQAAVLAKGAVVVPQTLVKQATAFGGGIYTQFIGPQPGRARIRAIKPPAIDPTLPCLATAPTVAGTQGCSITQSPTRYIRAVMRSLCAPAATGAASSRAGFPAVPATNLDNGVAVVAPAVFTPNTGAFFDINGARANLPGAGTGTYAGTAGTPSAVTPSDGTCLQSAQYANGLFTGQYFAPVTGYIFPENTLAGAPILPNNFWHMGFLAYGENGRDGNSNAAQVIRPW